jgi:hypothetical protein
MRMSIRNNPGESLWKDSGMEMKIWKPEKGHNEELCVTNLQRSVKLSPKVHIKNYFRDTLIKETLIQIKQ